jgi:hypothetical protein
VEEVLHSFSRTKVLKAFDFASVTDSYLRLPSIGDENIVALNLLQVKRQLSIKNPDAIDRSALLNDSSVPYRCPAFQERAGWSSAGARHRIPTGRCKNPALGVRRWASMQYG